MAWVERDLVVSLNISQAPKREEPRSLLAREGGRSAEQCRKKTDMLRNGQS